MRITHFYGHGGANGVTSFTADIIAGLRARGHVVQLICRTDSEMAKDPHCMTYRWLPGDLHHNGLRRLLTTTLQNDPPDVFHAHSHRDTALALSVAKTIGVPRCYTVQELSRVAGEPGKGANVVIAVSHGVARFLRDEKLLGTAQLVAIPNGIELQTMPMISRTEARVRWGFSAKDIVFGSVGRLTGNKNVVALTSACGQLVGDCAGLKLLVIGDGARAGAVRRSAAKLGFASRLTMPGWLPRADTLEAVAALDVFVLPSLGREGLSLAMLEAMALGVPVLASDIPSLVDGPLRQGETGWLFTPGTEDNLREAMRGILALSESARQKIGAAAAAEVRAHYTLAGVVDQVEKVYEGLAVGNH